MPLKGGYRPFGSQSPIKDENQTSKYQKMAES